MSVIYGGYICTYLSLAAAAAAAVLDAAVLEAAAAAAGLEAGTNVK